MQGTQILRLKSHVLFHGLQFIYTSMIRFPSWRLGFLHDRHLWKEISVNSFKYCRRTCLLWKDWTKLYGKWVLPLLFFFFHCTFLVILILHNVHLFDVTCFSGVWFIEFPKYLTNQQHQIKKKRKNPNKQWHYSSNSI